MKKHVLAMVALSLAVALGACSSPSSTDPTATIATSETAAETTATAGDDGTTTADTLEESTAATDPMAEVSKDYASGQVVKMEGNTLTILDDFEELERTFDVSDAAITRTYPLSKGDNVEVTFPEGAAGDIVEALAVEVIDSILAESGDPLMIGTIQDATGNTMVIQSDDGTYTFATAEAYKVTGSEGLKIGTEVMVNYLGEATEDEALMAIKIVTADSYDSDAAKINAFIGKVDSSNDNSLVLVSESGDYFTFTSSKINFTTFKKGDLVKITYEGSISAKEIPATAVNAI